MLLLTHLVLKIAHEVDIMIISILQVRKVRKVERKHQALSPKYPC